MAKINQINIDNTVHDIGVKAENIDGTVENAKVATKLKTAQPCQVYLNKTEVVNFDGTTSLPIGVAGVLPANHGGTGKTTLQDSANAFINALTTGSATPVDADYFISQYSGGGATTTTYHRRPISALWNYIKSKADNIYSTKSNMTDLLGWKASAWNNDVGTYVLTNPQNEDYIAVNANNDTLEINTHDTQKTYHFNDFAKKTALADKENKIRNGLFFTSRTATTSNVKNIGTGIKTSDAVLLGVSTIPSTDAKLIVSDGYWFINTNVANTEVIVNYLGVNL